MRDILNILKKRGLVFLLVLLTGGNWSCTKDAGSEGPQLRSLYGDFGVVEPLFASRDTVNFESETVSFSAKLAVRINWKITITGLESKAVKTITGKSQDVTSSNAVWNGSASQLPSFIKEKCVVALTFSGQSDTLKDTIFVKNTKLPGGIVLNDFNFINASATPIDYSADGCNFSSKSVFPGAKNKFYLNIEGTDKNGDTYLGSITLPAKSLIPSSIYFPLNTTDPNNVYFNVMIYGTGKTNSKLGIQFKEDEGALDGKFDPLTEDLYNYEVKADWNGWKLVSFKYKDTAFLTYGGAPGTSGNKIRDPRNILSVGFIVLTDPKGLATATAIDYPVFTENAFYVP